MKLFIWDFHGTLEKGNERAVIELSNEALARRGYAERFDDAHVSSLYGIKWHEYFAHILPHEPTAIHLQLQEDAIALGRKQPETISRYIAPNDHVTEVLAAIKETHDQILISNASPVHIVKFLHLIGLQNFFPEGKYFGTDSHHPDAKTSKQDIAEEYIAGKKFDRIIAIGDSPQDMIPLPDAVHYLYAHPNKAFKESIATYRIHDLRDVLRELS